MGPSPALEAINVSKQFPDGTIGLQDIDWAVHPGETMVLIGQSGSGKSTLLRLFNRLDEPTTGEIHIQGERALDQDVITLRRHIGYVQQDGGLLPHWTVERNVGLVPTLLGWSPVRCKEQVQSLLNLVQLDPNQHRHRYPSELSGGQRQRVAVARALAGDPPIILLDEPFGALDALTKIEMQEQFLNLKHRLTKTMVLVTHDLHEAFNLGDRVGVMKEGRILQVGSPRELMQRPAHEYVQSLIDLYQTNRTLEES
ncbi:MAG: ATP-binding cassette domain-containing protein [Nitrospirota bacterium]|nr:MAG: ATP-binding cassette domain-containing protein [Nitrospirota bacterium]